MSDVGDVVDRANDYAQAMLDARIAATRKDIQPGVPGDCERCGEASARLIGGACAHCSDKYGLP